MDKFRVGFFVLLGVVIGMACAPGKGPAALDSALAAGPSECSQWEVKSQDEADPIPAGWEPFGWQACSSGYDCLGIRRCVD
ncbi:MAG: hypothetical protein IPO67_01905 [Deltaproteobacteria bacterium]|nr:hypothetical protein [Deltaproteobacteria bacterium]